MLSDSQVDTVITVAVLALFAFLFGPWTWQNLCIFGVLYVVLNAVLNEMNR